jgi:hypothetical protein
MSSLRILCIQIFVLLGSATPAWAQLVSRDQVQSAKTKAILWTIFAVVMLGICIFQIVRYFKNKK